jgi:hypothetical protein
MSPRRSATRKGSPIDRATVVRLRVAEMMRTTFPGWPADRLEKIIYEASNPGELMNLINHFLDELPGGMHHAAADQVISVIQDAWNYLPHRSLRDRSPGDLMQEK